jgi:hypothetical protein
MSSSAWRRRAAAVVVGLALAPAGAAGAADDDGAAPPSAAVGAPEAYAREIDAWRAAREERLRADDGWLTVSGLFWLQDGANRAGSAEDDAVRLPASVPPGAAVLELRQGRVSYRLSPGVSGATLDGAPAPASGELRADDAGRPSLLGFGPVTLHVIRRGERVGVRAKDRDSAARRDFKGLDWYPVDASWRLEARFVAHAEPVFVRVPNVLGQVLDMPSPGDVVFTRDGHEVRLTPVLEEDDASELFFIFKDATSGKTTYPAGRFLYAPLPKDGRVTLDFNKAYSPPCAFTPYATCPLPPQSNRLGVAITAGEKSAAQH